jgi:aspartate/methionine/tyrosine aminotransferase
MRFAARMKDLGTETAFEVLAKAKALERQGRTVIHLEIGEPDFATPEHIVEAGIRALRDGHTHYTPSPGIPELREAIAEHLTGSRGVAVTPDRVVVTPGAKPIMFYTILATVGPGDEALVPDPGFPIYASVVRFAGGVSVSVPLREEHAFRMQVEDVAQRITPRTRLLILNSPHNPCGSALTKADLEGIADLAVRHDLVVLADEIYCEMVYEGSHASIFPLPGMAERTVLLDGFSKTYAMTGWRLGYGAMPVPLAEHVTRLMVNSNSCTAAFTQWAGITALKGPQEPSRKMIAEFRRRRDYLVPALNAIPGIRCAMPPGAFYVFPNITGLPTSAHEFADLLLQRYGVAVLAGTCFGECGGGFLRLSYANSLENLQKAADLMRAAAASDLLPRRA